MRMLRQNWRHHARRLRNCLLILVFVVIICFCQIKSMQQQEVIHIIKNSSAQYLFAYHEDATTESNLSKLETIVLDKNKEERVLNEDAYGPVTKDTIIIVVMVDNYSMYLKFMLYSLSQVKGIQDALLIFSHSNYDENLNILIKTIDFCRVLQIFYPHSVQLHPNKFPGLSPDDCPPGMPVAAAEVKNCTGAYYSNIHGHYRNPQLSEKKHHWWWTANQVFGSLTTTEKHIGTVVFVQDDCFFFEDFLYMTGYMKNLADTIMFSCEFLSLGSLPETDETVTVQRAVEVVSWDPVLHSEVLAFDLFVWNSIVSHYDLFCEIDHSWSQSLSYLSDNRKDGGRYKVMTSVFPRAYKLSQCFYFRELLGCGIYSSVYQIISLQRSLYYELFPANVEVFVNIKLEDDYTDFDIDSINGGWNDPRDRELCANLTVNKLEKL